MAVGLINVHFIQSTEKNVKHNTKEISMHIDITMIDVKER